MGKEILVSVIVPVYNVKPYLAEALDSILQQTYEWLEIIVIDDGSTDGSDIICNEYAARDKRIKVIHQENRGLSSARNVGLDNATGQIISFLDPDDAFHPRMIQILLSEMKKNRTEIAICGFSDEKISDMLNVNAYGVNSKGSNSVVIDKNTAFRKIADGYIDTAVWNKLYIRKIWDDLRFPDGFVYEGTYIVFDLFSRIKEVTLVDEKLIMHRKRSGSICHTVSLKNILDGQYAIDHYITFIERLTPEVFSYNQLSKIRQSRIRRVISAYLQYSYSNPKAIEGRESIHQQAIEAGSGERLQNCTIYTKIIYYTVKMFPGLSVIMYCLYRYLKSLMGRDGIQHDIQ